MLPHKMSESNYTLRKIKQEKYKNLRKIQSSLTMGPQLLLKVNAFHLTPVGLTRALQE